MITLKESMASITISGTETVQFENGYYKYAAISNTGGNDIYVSAKNSECIAPGDGTICIQPGASTVIRIFNAAFFISGEGVVQLIGQYDNRNPFKMAAKGGDSPTPEPKYEYVENPIISSTEEQANVISSGSNGYWPNAWMVFDGAIDTGSDRWVGNAGDDSWVQYTFSEPKQLAYIYFNPTKESVNTTYKLTVYGTNDNGTTLTELYSTGDSGMIMGSGYTRIDIDATEKFKAFRFAVKAAGEIRMYTKEIVS